MSKKIFLFPLRGVVLFPHTSKPLNIFEPRYVKMINDALEKEAWVALANADPSRAGGREAGVLAHVRRIAGVGRVRLLERRADQTMLILLEAEGKVRLEHIVPNDEPYYTVAGTVVAEDEALARENLFLLNRMVKDFNRWLMNHVGDAEQRALFVSQLKTAAEKINTICSLMVPDPETQQKLLETEDVNERLKLASLHILETEFI